MLTLDEKFPDRYVCVLGLGYVGLTLAAVMADVGFKVLGVEIRETVVRDLRKGKAHFFEPGLDDLLERLVEKKQIKFVQYIPRQVRANVYIITVGTPLGPNGKARLDMVDHMSREVSQHLKHGDLVIVRSTMKIGTTRRIVLPMLEKAKVDFDLAFCPERTLEGQAMMELRQLPQIVGGVSFRSSVRAAQLFQFLTPTVVRVSDIETAEMIKLIDNAQRDVSFAYANEVARICDRVGISAMEVIRAGKLGYPRTHLPMPGPVGGPCLEKDPYILAEGLRELGLETEMTLISRRINERQPREAVSFIHETVRRLKGFPARPVISLMGLAFKGRPATDDLRGTMAKPIFEQLKRHFPNATYRGFDAVVAASQIRAFGLTPVSNLEKAMRKAHLVLIMNNHPVFSAMPVETLARGMGRPGLIYDFWNSFTASTLRLPDGVGYMALGSHGKAILPLKGK
ncbi:MAG: nucleotide sugar dehydrogenase [Elusimicrobia bacterium]|nr:nucleotide sugar dehydrogenase [Candidatus Obscuribacterium magneticum]